MMSRKAILSAIVAAAGLAAQVQRTLADMEPTLARIAAYEYNQPRAPLAAFTEFVQGSMGSPERLAQIEARLLQFLQSGATAAGKDFALRELSLIATPASIPVLSALLMRDDTAEMARYALARIPGSAVDEVLRNALDKTSGKTRIGIVNSLGQRRDAKSVPALSALVSSSDPAAAEAAVAALTQIADRPALNALAGALGKVSGPLELRVADAYIQCADQFAARGDAAAALKVYRELLRRREPETLRIAALRGLAAAAGRDAVPTLTAELASKSPGTQAAAIRLLSGIPGPEVTSLLVREFPKLPASGQVRLLAALADRGDATAGPLFRDALKSGTEEVRAASLAGLGQFGDASSVTVLAEAAATSEGATQAAARESLYRLRGPGIDAAIVAAIGSASGKMRIELITAAGERASAAATDALLQAARAQDPETRRESLKALRNVAGSAQVPALLEALLKASGASERREAVRTLATVLKGSEPARIDVVVAAYQSAGAVESRVSLLEVMGQASSDGALPLLRSSVADPRPEIARAAILALSEWPGPAPLPDLLAAAKGGATPALQVLALRGFLKVLGTPAQRPCPENAKLAAEALSLAKQPAEKSLALSLLATFPFRCKEGLALAETYLTDAAVANEAQAAVQQIRSTIGTAR